MKWNMIISPLYTHWRHRLMLSGVGEGCSCLSTPQIEKNNKKNHNQTTAVFCSFNENIEQHLHYLHSKTQMGDRKYQSEIDRYIVACLEKRFQHLILPLGNAPHYDNLPDFSFYAISILDPSKDGIIELQQIFLLLRQCTPLRRRTKRAQRELQWESYSIEGLHHLVISMQGTLLGLYPSCARTVAFVARVQIYRLIRSLLVADFQTLNECLQRIRYILKISVMEHLCNTITDYHPGIRHMLNKAGQQLQHFCNAVTTMCDIFRGELNSLFVKTKCIFTSMIQMEKSAHSFFERCTRAYRGIITNHTSVFSSLELLRKRNLSPNPLFISSLKNIYSAASQYIFELVHKDLVPQEFLEIFWHLTQSIAVHALPAAIRERQYQALCRKYTEDSICIERCRKVYVCIYCSIKRNITGGQLQCAKIRKDCTACDGTLLCANCNIASILVLDILGRVANIGDQKILLSSCCASLIYYKGSGKEFDTTCGEQCARQNQFSKGRSPRVQQNEQNKSLPVQAKRTHCYVCRQKNTVNTFELLNVEERRLVRFHLCSKHNLGNDLVESLGDEMDLVKTLKCIEASKGKSLVSDSIKQEHDILPILITLEGPHSLYHRHKRLGSLDAQLPTEMQPCHAEDVLSCRCSKDMDDIMHSADASYYPRAGCFRLGGRMFTARGYDAMFGRHLLETIVHAPRGFSTRGMLTDAANHKRFLSIKVNIPATANGVGSRAGMFIPIYSTRRNDTANFAVHIWRIQRVVRDYLRRKYEARALALGMGWHKRLGKHSCFADIPEDLMCAMVPPTPTLR